MSQNKIQNKGFGLFDFNLVNLVNPVYWDFCRRQPMGFKEDKCNSLPK